MHVETDYAAKYNAAIGISWIKCCARATYNWHNQWRVLQLINSSIAALPEEQGNSARPLVTPVTHLRWPCKFSGVRVSPPSCERVPSFFLAHSGLGCLRLAPLGAHSGLGRSRKRPLGAHSGLGPWIFYRSDSNSHSDFSDVRVPPADFLPKLK
jgi:hypothetical protein